MPVNDIEGTFLADDRAQRAPGGQVRGAGGTRHGHHVYTFQIEGGQLFDETAFRAHRRIDGMHVVAARLHAPAQIDEMPARAATARFQHLKKTHVP